MPWGGVQNSGSSCEGFEEIRICRGEGFRNSDHPARVLKKFENTMGRGSEIQIFLSGVFKKSQMLWEWGQEFSSSAGIPDPIGAAQASRTRARSSVAF